MEFFYQTWKVLSGLFRKQLLVVTIDDNNQRCLWYREIFSEFECKYLSYPSVSMFIQFVMTENVDHVYLIVIDQNQIEAFKGITEVYFEDMPFIYILGNDQQNKLNKKTFPGFRGVISHTDFEEYIDLIAKGAEFE